MLNLYSAQNRPIYNNNPVNFKGRYGTSSIGKQEFTHDTRFLRNFPGLEFTADYIKRVFLGGTHIAEFGCSQGQKPYSLMALLSEVNKDKRYTITGYDIAPNIIEEAKAGGFEIDIDDGKEAIFFPIAEHATNIDGLPQQKIKQLRKAFFEYFELQTSTKDRLLKLKPGKALDVVDFQVGNIEKIDTILPAEKSGVVIFQNALYHVLDPERKVIYGPNHNQIPLKQMDNVENLFRKIHKVLPENGIFVVGSFCPDHRYTYRNKQCPCRLTYQDGKRIEVFDSSQVHDALRKTGFEPIFYEQPEYTDAPKDLAYLPSVWRKISQP